MEAWDDKAIGEVTPSMLRDWIGSLGVTSKRARNLLTPLRGVFKDALNDEVITRRPFDKIALNKLLRHARADEAPMLRFWLSTGLRPGEMIALRWSKVDWVGRKARVDRNQVNGIEKGPKTAAGVRDVELDDEGIAALIAQKSATLPGR